MNENNTIATIIAFFLSKFDKRALDSLGYNTQTECWKDLSNIIKTKNAYIRLRRDEFDVFFDNGRAGWHKREPAQIIIEYKNKYNNLSFEELYNKCKELIEICKKSNQRIIYDIIRKDLSNFSETDIESIINFNDNETDIIIENKLLKQRILDTSIIKDLKKYYKFKCQICGIEHYSTYNVNIVEVHHIKPFIETLNNNPTNLIVLCPNHHRLIHKAKPEFDTNNKSFIYKNDNRIICEEHLKINDHL